MNQILNTLQDIWNNRVLYVCKYIASRDTHACNENEAKGIFLDHDDVINNWYEYGLFNQLIIFYILNYISCK